MAAINVMEHVRERFGYTYKLKPEQLEVISYLLKGESVLSVLPTGYGKSDRFIILPLVREEVCPNL
jgi:ATP-dependent DNA helicase RecQ